MSDTPKFRFTLLRCARLLSDEINQLLINHQLNYSLWQALVIIQLNPNCSAVDIANELSISKPAVTKRLNALLTLGLIQDAPSSDKRQKSIHLTDLGIKQFQICSNQIDELEHQILSNIDPNALEQSYNFISDLMQKLQARKVNPHV